MCASGWRICSISARASSRTSNAEQVTPHPHHPRESLARDRDARRKRAACWPSKAATRVELLMIDKRVPSLAAAVAGVRDGMTVLCCRLRRGRRADRAYRSADRSRRPGSGGGREQRRHARGRRREAHPRGAGAQDRLLLSAHHRSACVRGRLQGRPDRIGAGAAGHLSERMRAGRRRHRRLLHPRLRRDQARRGQGDARDRRPAPRAGEADEGRTSPWSGPIAPTAGAISSIASRRGTSIRSWRWRPS